ncbi:Protein STR-14 [Aphelenchoides avenae]|nr:Protein STR-14 [Aphelenchus avenae]
MKAYKRILLMTCCVDIWLAAIVFFVQPVHLVGSGNMILVSNGFFAGRSPTMDHVGLAIYCASLHSSIVCVVAQFFMRYRSMCHATDPKTPALIAQFVAIAALYCVTQATDATFTFAFGHSVEMRQTALSIIRQNYKWEFEAGREPYPTLSHYTEAKTLIHHVFYTISCTGGYTLVIWCQSRIAAYLSRHGESFNPATRKTHQGVNRALVALAITPLISLMGPTFAYIAQVMLDFNAPCMSYVSSFMSMITLVNPLTTMYFVPAYRKAVLRMVRRKWDTKGFTETTTMDARRSSIAVTRRQSRVGIAELYDAVRRASAPAHLPTTIGQSK